LLVAGILVLALAFRSVRAIWAQKVGALTFVVASFVAGWRLSGSWVAGLVCAATWLLLPWVEILTRVRALRLPRNQDLRVRPAPGEDRFPGLEDLTREVESAGFEWSEDAGWEWEGYQQHFRLFYHRHDRAMACISLVEQSGFAIHYLSVSSREPGGRIWTTTNNPLPGSLKAMPCTRVRRTGPVAPFGVVWGEHRRLLERAGVTTGGLAEVAPEGVAALVEGDLREQVAYNLGIGVLARTEDDLIRYTWRGFWFLWVQLIADLFRMR
jgi:hypothetical protein